MAAAEEAKRAQNIAPGMRRVGSKTWLPVDGVADSLSNSPRSVSVREKMKEKLWMSEAVDAYFLRQNDLMLEKTLPKIRADIATDSRRAVVRCVCARVCVRARARARDCVCLTLSLSVQLLSLLAEA